MIELCLEVLVSGVLSVSGMNLAVDHNNSVMYTTNNKVQYVLPDKINLSQLCESEERFALNVEKPFNLIKSID